MAIMTDTINDHGVKPHDHTLKAIVTELGMDVGEEQVLGDDQERRKTKRSQMCCAIVCVLVALLEKEVLDKSTILSALRTPPDP